MGAGSTSRAPRRPPPAPSCTSPPTGQGNVIGSPIEPVVELTASPRTARETGERIDPGLYVIPRREITMDPAGDALVDICLRTGSGRVTAAEAPGHREPVMTKLYRSA